MPHPPEAEGFLAPAVTGQPRTRVRREPIVARDAHEEAALHHYRGDCHDSRICPPCIEGTRLYQSGMNTGFDEGVRSATAVVATGFDSPDLEPSQRMGGPR